MKNDIRFLVTKACNYDCYFCHSEGVGDVIRRHQLSVEDYITLYEVYSNLEKWNGVTLSGGEPLLFKDFDVLVEELHKKGANITVVTNGSLLHLHLPAMKYVKRINVSIHTLNPMLYSQITNREERKLFIVKENLKIIRNFYPEIEIRLNVTPCKNQNWNMQELQNLIAFAEEIKASIKCTELFPNTLEDCVRIETLREELQNLGYTYKATESRTECFVKAEREIYLTQCTCSKAILFDNPVAYCRANHDLYVNYNATFSLCRLGKESIDFWEEIEERNLDVLEMKMRLAKIRVSKEACQQHLRCVYF